MSQSLEFETDGMWPLGKMVVTCGHYELCFQDIPQPTITKQTIIQELPPVLPPKYNWGWWTVAGLAVVMIGKTLWGFKKRKRRTDVFHHKA